MCKISGVILFLFFINGHVASQILPKEGSHLNYRLIGFSFAGTIKRAGEYKIEIAEGKFDNETDFKKNITQTIECRTTKKIIEVPEFGSDYTWQTVATDKQKKSRQSGLHHFTVQASVNVDTNNIHLRIISNKGKYKDDYIFIDYTQALYDMNGRPVWFYEDPALLANGNSNIRDIKLTKDGTLTFIMGDRACEINYDGKIVWEAPYASDAGADNAEHFHHELTKLGNGHYMVLGTESVSWKLPYLKDDSAYLTDDASITKDSADTFRQKLKFGTVIEYDDKGKVVWIWKSSGYFKNSDLYRYHLPNGKFANKDVHENSFFFDEKAKVVYVGFRDVSRILKVKYPEGTVLAEYGNQYKEGMEEPGNELFCGQHSIRISTAGNMLLFNNNAFTPADLPKLEILKEPVNGKGGLKKIWEYDCQLDGINKQEMDNHNKKIARMRNLRGRNMSAKIKMTSGGNFMELPGDAYFASLNSPFSKILIVSRDKNILWSALLERKNSQDSLWSALPVYRANIITNRKDLEKLVWDTEGVQK